MASDAVLVADFSTRSRLPQVRDKKGDRRHKYAGGRPPTLEFIAGQEWSRAKRQETRARTRVYANDETGWKTGRRKLKWMRQGDYHLIGIPLPPFSHNLRGMPSRLFMSGKSRQKMIASSTSLKMSRKGRSTKRF